jgi:hypothetical protein
MALGSDKDSQITQGICKKYDLHKEFNNLRYALSLVKHTFVTMFIFRTDLKNTD